MVSSTGSRRGVFGMCWRGREWSADWTVACQPRLREYSAMDVTGDHKAQNLSTGQRDVMKLIVRGLSNKEIASILNLAEGTMLTARECLQSARSEERRVGKECR